MQMQELREKVRSQENAGGTDVEKNFFDWKRFVNDFLEYKIFL